MSLSARSDAAGTCRQQNVRAGRGTLINIKSLTDMVETSIR